MFVFSGSWDKWKRFCVLLLGVCTVNTSLVFWLQSLARFLVLALELQLLKCIYHRPYMLDLQPFCAPAFLRTHHGWIKEL